MKWGAFAFVLMAIAMQGLGIHLPGSKPQPLHWGLPSLAAYKSQLIPGYGQLQMASLTPGKGEAAVCGQDVEIRFTAPEAAIAPKKPEAKTMSFHLGDASQPRGLQESVVGMKPGGMRDVHAATKDKAVPNHFTVELISATPALPAADADTLPFRIFERHESPGPRLSCGDTAQALLTIWDMQGHKLLEMHDKNATMAITPGDGKSMLGLEIGVSGMSPDGSRTLIIPPSLQAPLRLPNAPDVLHNVKIPPHQAILVDVDLVE